MSKNKDFPLMPTGEVKLAITDLNHHGEGVGKIGGYVLFVPGALPGEVIEAIITDRRAQYGRAELTSIVESSSSRITPVCRYFPDCGGCRLQHLAYEEQLAWKRKRVAETLRRVGALKITVNPVIGMQDPWRYRNKAGVHITAENGTAENAFFKVGFYRYGSHRIIDISRCPVQHQANETAINSIRRALERFAAQKLDSKGTKLQIKGAEVRTVFTSGHCSVVLIPVSGSRGRAAGTELARLIKEEASGIVTGISLFHARKTQKAAATLLGQPDLIEEIGNFKFRLSPLSFFQVNPQQAAILYETAATFAGNPSTVFDLYCGTGSLSLYLGRIAENVVGIDSEKSAIEDARINAELNEADNVDFFHDQAEAFPDLPAKVKSPLTICLNPPRGGCSGNLLQLVATASPERIVYVSCNPATLARDLSLLVKSGYSVQQVQPVDMFPHTSHVECVIGMQRKDA